MLEAQLAEIARDRVHGAGYLARKALGMMAAAPPAARRSLALRLATLRPEMPALEAAVMEALEVGNVRAVLERADAERRAMAAEAVSLLEGSDRVATISNSSFVARVLVKARPPLVEVVVGGRGDEGHLMVRELRTTGIDARPVRRPSAPVAVVGCDAVFADGAFVNRRGTSTLVAATPLVIVLGERWKRLPGPAPGSWPQPRMFEIVSPAPNVRLLST